MLTLRLDTSGFQRLKEQTLDRIRNDTADAVHEGLETGATYARGHHQHHRRTGHLSSDAIRTEILSTGPGGTMGALHNDAPYAGFVEYGTKPHRISAKPGSYLRFEVGVPTVHGFNESSETVYAKFVNHPGTSPMPFMHPAAQVAVADIRRRILAALGNVANLWK